jgi:hypothetical protein
MITMGGGNADSSGAKIGSTVKTHGKLTGD